MLVSASSISIYNHIWIDCNGSTIDMAESYDKDYKSINLNFHFRDILGILVRTKYIRNSEINPNLLC